MMRILTPLAAVLLLVWLTMASAFAQAKPEAGIEWARDLEDAKKISAGKRPIAVFLSQQGCKLSVEFMRNLVKDDRLPELAPGFVWLSVQVGTEEYKNWFVKTCAGNVEGTPSLIFLNPAGDNADPDFAGLSAVTSTDPDDIIPVFRGVLQRVKKEEPEKDKQRVREALAKAKAAAVPAEAIAAYDTVIHWADGWRGEEATVQEARAAIEKLLQAGNAEMLRVLQSVQDPKAQIDAFDAVKKQYAGTCTADWANDEIVRLKKPQK